jgi:hypothetical protein
LFSYNLVDKFGSVVAIVHKKLRKSKTSFHYKGLGIGPHIVYKGVYIVSSPVGVWASTPEGCVTKGSDSKVQGVGARFVGPVPGNYVPGKFPVDAAARFPIRVRIVNARTETLNLCDSKGTKAEDKSYRLVRGHDENQVGVI